MTRPKSLTFYQWKRHLLNIQSDEIVDAYIRFTELNEVLRRRVLTDKEKLEKESVGKILDVEQKGEFRIYKNVKIIKNLPTGEHFIFDGVSKSFLSFIDGNDDVWEIEFSDCRPLKESANFKRSEGG